jgi:hypothetical protein
MWRSFSIAIIAFFVTLTPRAIDGYADVGNHRTDGNQPIAPRTLCRRIYQAAAIQDDELIVDGGEYWDLNPLHLASGPNISFVEDGPEEECGFAGPRGPSMRNWRTSRKAIALREVLHSLRLYISCVAINNN